MKKLLITFILALTMLFSYSQTYNMTDGVTTNTCSGTFYDPEGTSDYNAVASPITQTFCSDNGQPIIFDFTSFSAENNRDELIVYDGPTSGSPVIGTYDGSPAPGTITSTGTCLTFEWDTDNDGGLPGWVANISCNSPPAAAGDDCFTAIDLDCNTVDLAGTTIGTTEIPFTGNCGNDFGRWYSFVGHGGETTIACTATSGWDHEMETFEGPCTSLTSLDCADAGFTDGTETYTFTTTLGTTYYVYIAHYSSWAGASITGDFTISRECPCGPEFTLANGGNNCPADEYFIDVDITSLGTATSATLLIDGVIETINITTLGIQTIGTFIGGQTVNVQIVSEQDGTCLDDLDFTTPSACPPLNDECADAILLTVNPTDICTAVTSGTTTNATQSADTEGCFGNANDDVWYEFTATSTVHYISLLNITGSTTDMYYSLYTGSCGSLFEALCNDNDISTVSSLVIGTLYKMRVYTYSSTAGANTTFDICIGTPPPPPANDECDDAISLTVSPDMSCANIYSSSTVSSTESGIAACVGFGADDDVWFSFIATDVQLGIEITSVTDMVHEVFSGDCATPFSALCSDPNISEAGGYVIGDTYWVRVYTYYTTAEGAFDICIYEIVPTCDDGVLNQDETAVDCGGAICPECAAMSTAQDCSDATAVCGNETIEGNSNGTGATDDVDASNEGCLSGEHESNWVYFKVLTEGWLYFTISPTNGTDDYDFGIWAGTDCPPSTLPIRCSFSAGAGLNGSVDTGLDINNDLLEDDESEDTGGDNWLNPIYVYPGEEYIMLIDNYTASTNPYTLIWDMGLGDAALDCDVVNPTGCASALFISEVVEGTWHNKAIEIVNETGMDVDLTNYSLQRDNGVDDTFPFGSQTVDLVGTILDNDVFVIVRDGSDTDVSHELVTAPYVDQITTLEPLNFNGDDQIILRKSGLEIDRFSGTGAQKWLQKRYVNHITFYCI